MVCEATITLQDVAVLLGLRIHGDPVTYILGAYDGIGIGIELSSLGFSGGVVRGTARARGAE